MEARAPVSRPLDLAVVAGRAGVETPGPTQSAAMALLVASVAAAAVAAARPQEQARQAATAAREARHKLLRSHTSDDPRPTRPGRRIGPTPTAYAGAQTMTFEPNPFRTACQTRPQ